MNNVATQTSWPAIDYATIRPTADHLHRLTQIAGKYTLNQPYESNWANILMSVTPRGYRSPVLRQGDVDFEIEYNLVDDQVTVMTNAGSATLSVAEGSVSDFYAEFEQAVAPLGIGPIGSFSQPEIAGAPPIHADTEVRPYNSDAATLIAFALGRAADAFGRYQSSYRGARPRTGLWWGGFDISASRFHGQRVPASASHPVFMQNGMLEEVVAVGFSFGDERSPQASFYAYIAPQPEGLEGFDLGHPGAAWYPDAGLMVLPWNAVCADADPIASVVAFADRVYAAAVELCGWPADLTIERVDGWQAAASPVVDQFSKALG